MNFCNKKLLLVILSKSNVVQEMFMLLWCFSEGADPAADVVSLPKYCRNHERVPLEKMQLTFGYGPCIGDFSDHAGEGSGL